MSRSVMIKGLEALVIESYTTDTPQHGVEDHVLPTSVQKPVNSIDWQRKQSKPSYASKPSVVQHGKRRAEQMNANLPYSGVIDGGCGSLILY
jgi:hypothetical protein